MSGARVNSVDALKLFRAALIKFADVANVALGDAEGEVQRTVMWLGGEQQQYWTTQIRKRQEIVQRCKEAVRQKKLFKDSTGKTQSAVDEEKQLLAAERKLRDAEEKLAATKRHYNRLQKEMHMYKGATTRLLTAVTSDVPNAAATLDNFINSIEAYLALQGGGGGGVEGLQAPTAGEAGMGRGDTTEAPVTQSPEEAAAAEAEEKPAAEEPAPTAATDKPQEHGAEPAATERSGAPEMPA